IVVQRHRKWVRSGEMGALFQRVCYNGQPTQKTDPKPSFEAGLRQSPSTSSRITCRGIRFMASDWLFLGRSSDTVYSTSRPTCRIALRDSTYIPLTAAPLP